MDQDVKSSDGARHFARHIAKAPSEQNAFDMFPQAWRTRFLGEVDSGGETPFFTDRRIHWLCDHVNLKDKTVLELGTLEAAHTWMLEQVGAHVLSIEGNEGIFLRSLISKNYMNLSAKILLGDFTLFDYAAHRFDLIFASGVLYHMTSPLTLLKQFSQATDKLYLWTHYFEPDLTVWHTGMQPFLADRTFDVNAPHTEDLDGLPVRMVRKMYGAETGWVKFTGGNQPHSYWVYREDLLKALSHLGFTKQTLAFEQPDNANGPAFSILAEKE